MPVDHSIQDLVAPVPHAMVMGKNDKEKKDISRGYRAFTRLKDQESLIATEAFLKTASAEERVIKPFSRVFVPCSKEVVKIVVPRTLRKLACRTGWVGPSQKEEVDVRNPPVSTPSTHMYNVTNISMVRKLLNDRPKELSTIGPVSCIKDNDAKVIHEEDEVVIKNPTPSEKIALLYTPTANVRSNNRNDKMTSYDYLIHRKDVPPPLPHPLMKEESKGVKGEDPLFSHFIDLEEFDDIEYEIHTPEEWIQLGAGKGGTPARSKYLDDNGVDIWLPCRVTEYNEIERVYTLCWNHNNKKKNANRYNVVFDEESEEMWKCRISRATAMRDEAESQIRLHLYIESLDDNIVTPVDENQVDRILFLVAKEFPLKYLDIIEICTAEMRDVYKHALKKALHNYNFKDPYEQIRLAYMKLPVPATVPPESLSMMLATIDTPSPNFIPVREYLRTNLFQTNKIIQPTLRAMNDYCQEISCIRFCDTILEGVTFPCEMRLFDDKQYTKGSSVAQHLCDIWSPNIKTAINNGLELHFNFYEDDKEKYKVSRMYRLFKMINIMMSSMLRQLLVKTIEDYAEFFEKFKVILPKDFSPEDDVIEELPSDKEERIHWENRANEIRAYREEKLKSQIQDVKNTNSRMKTNEEAEDKLEEEDQEREEEVLTIPYISNVLPFSSRIVYMTQNTSKVEPLFVLRLVNNGNCVVLSPLLEEIEDKVKGIFDGFFTFSDKIKGIGDQLFPFLKLAPEILKPIARDDPDVIRSQDTIYRIIEESFQGPKQLQQMYASFEYILQIDVDSFVEDFSKKQPPPTLIEFEVILERLQRDSNRIQSRTINEVKFELICVECEGIKSSLLTKAKCLSKTLMELLSYNMKAETDRLSEVYFDIIKRMKFVPSTIEELKDLREYIKSVPKEMDSLEIDFQRCTDAKKVLSKYSFIPDYDGFIGYWAAFEWPKKVQNELVLNDLRCKEHLVAFKQELSEKCTKLTEDISDLSNKVDYVTSYTDESLASKYYERLNDLETKIRNREEKIKKYNSQETILRLPCTHWPELNEIKVRLIPYRDLWDVAYNFDKYSAEWMSRLLESLDVTQIDHQMQQWTMKISNVIKHVNVEGPLNVARRLKEQLESFKANLPLIRALQSNLQLSHWNEIFLLVKADPKSDPSEKLSLREYIEMDMLVHINRIEEVASTANKTFVLEAELSQMEADWRKLSFEMEPFRNTYKLKFSDAVQQTLDEHIIKTQSILSKPIIRQGIAPTVTVKVNNWSKTLLNLQNTLDEWYKCQNIWSYLEPIFSFGDISKSMPAEAATFRNVNASWMRIMETTRARPFVIVRCADESLVNDLSGHIKILEEILRKVHIFLEVKRMSFPRFYFISNEELLQILSDSNDPYLVQPYLAKFFEGIKRIRFQDNLDITAMESVEGEVIQFSRKINPADYGNAVELWLSAVETVMAESIREQLRKSHEDYVERKRVEFIRQWPGQVVIAICSLFWTAEATEAMEYEGAKGLLTYHDKCCTQLDDLVMLVRDCGLSVVQRCTIEALVVIEVHSRDIVLELGEKGVDSANSFDWLAQLRYYWTSDGHLDVCQINARLRYGYEYLGNSGRLVITQLTDRCYRTLMGALHLNYGGAPEGPAGTGKTETVKDLAKSLGKYCVVYNCSDQITSRDMAKLFKGLAQSGAWGCFDEFNRIEIQVLSVIAQQLATIQEAISHKKVEFNFEGCQLLLKQGSAVFITMNPGYAGRAELPDNLKSLFRPVAMMVPNYAMIGQIQLFSYGFLHGKVLSEKIVATYRLCSEQLSSQDHYDYGMRAVKTVLTAAGRLKRQYPDENEHILMLRSIQDVNLPKFLAQDVELFNGIISDLFPGVTLPPPNYVSMEAALREVCEECNLQPTNYFLNKCYQTYEMIVVRHGMMLVGHSFGGKTKVLHSLASALGVLSHQKKEVRTRLTTINPKAITMGQLYGMIDQAGEWNDGVLSNAFRTAAADTMPDRKWLVLDGPVDAIWIESMNTVLDDNKKICLQNGDIIPMSKEMNMIFEVQDLLHASPATVSRCGMVYLDPETLGWRCLIDSYRNVLPNFIKESDRCLELYDTIMDWLISPLLEHIRRNAATWQGGCIAVSSFIRLFDSMITIMDEHTSLEEDKLGAIIEGYILFALAWGFGGPLVLNDRIAFNSVFVNLLDQGSHKGTKVTCPVPDKDKTFFDGQYQMKDNVLYFIDWLETLEEFTIPEHVEYQSIIVPTADTAKYSFLTTTLINSNCSPMLVGETGTGKTIMIKSLLHNYPKDQFSLNLIQFSAQTSANDVQKLIDTKCERRRKGVYGPCQLKKMLIFIDDVNIPELEEYGAQPPIELVRQWLDHGGWYNHTKENMDFREVVDILFITAMGSPGSGGNIVTQRFSRHFNTITIPAFDGVTLRKIFSCLTDWIFSKRYPQSMLKMTVQLVDATVGIYDTVLLKLKPTPGKFHYTFNLRDVSKVFQGIEMAHPRSVNEPSKMYRLWAHEVFRAFADRFTEQKDTDWFTGVVDEVMSKHFNVSYKSINPSDDPIIFGDFMNDREQYEEVACLKECRRELENKLELYNQSSRTGGMELVIFPYVIEHVARISRILKLPGGNALLIGVGGSGRHSCTQLAAYTLGYEYRTISVSKDYCRSDFLDNIREMLVKTGQNGCPVVFTLSDTQITDEIFLEDVSNLLNTGEIPGIFESKQDQETLNNIIVALKDLDSQGSKESIIALFVERCRKYLHIVLCFSPLGNVLRERLRRFPALVNCTTIDWFRKWPNDGLHGVAARLLNDIDLSDELKDSIVKCFVTFHTDVQDLGKVYYEEVRQNTYVTPTSYLELMSLFKNLLYTKRAELIMFKVRYDKGVEQLKKTECDVADMKGKLAVMLPQLEKKAEETNALIIAIEKEENEVKAVQATVAIEEEAANKTAERAKNIKDISQAKANEAQPKLEAARRASENLDNAALAEVKQTKKVMEGSVPATVIEALCKMLGGQYKPKPVRDPQNGKISYPYFQHAGRTLLNQNFKSTLSQFATEMEALATDENMTSVEKMLTLPAFDDKAVAKASQALLGISTYIKNMVQYYNLNKVVRPLLLEAAVAQKEYDAAMDELKVKKEELSEINEQLEGKREYLRSVIAEKEVLENSVKDTQVKISRAVKLIDGLGGEKERYIQESKRYEKEYQFVVGDVVLSAGIVAYLGPFQSKYRAMTVQKWLDMCREFNIPFSPNFTLERFLGDPVSILDWKLQHLPSDSFSVDNAIIMSKSQRYPLLIDPQGQANNWIRNMERKNNLCVLRPDEKLFIRNLSDCVRNGRPALIENVGEDLDPTIENLLLKRFSREGNIQTVVIGEQVEWNDNFRLYITTKLPRPHYRPEVSTKVAVINFMITPGGLQDQLLKRVMLSERKEVEEKKEAMTKEAASNKASLKETEDTILTLLSGEGSVLENEATIQQLDSSKVQSDKMAARQQDINAMEKISDRTRQQFVPVASIGASLFFCVVELANIDPMYQYSLQLYISLFQSALVMSELDEEVNNRVDNIIKTFKELLYVNICRSLFAKDQLLFSFIICLKLFEKDPVESRWLLMGGFERDSGLPRNPHSEWLPDLNWKLLWRASSQLPAFKSITDEISKYEEEVKNFYTTEYPMKVVLPGMIGALKGIQRLIFFRCLRLDRVVTAVSMYVESSLGPKFVEAPLLNLEQVIDEQASDVSVPIIFVLSQGADPNAELDRVASINGMLERTFKLSLGQGQDIPARALITEAVKVGNWVVLQNCHLYRDFMPELANIIEDLSRDETKEKIHKRYRLWLTSLPSDDFPVSVLQNGVKLVQEPPKGLKNNILRSFSSDPISDDKFFNGSNKPGPFKKLLFGLTFFHSLVQERRKFGPLGWNQLYEFNDTDMRISIRQLQMFINENQNIPFDAIIYLVGECNYGGRVTDDWDRRCLLAILKVFLTPDILQEDYRFSIDCPEYYAPPEGSHDSYMEYTKSLPISQNPSIFGLHHNADITKYERDAKLLMDATLSTQPRDSGDKTVTLDPKRIVLETAMDVHDKLPETFDIETVLMKYPLTYSNSMNTVLMQELIRYNRLIIIVRKSLSDVQKAIRGEVVMSADIEQVLYAIYDGKIPKQWKKRSFPSLKPFGSYIEDLNTRLEFLQSWIDKGQPSIFWISGFFFTQSFLTGVMQNYARKHIIEIDKLVWDFTVMSEENFAKPPEDGCYINGLFLEGAGWSTEINVLCESKPKELYIKFPIIYLKPVKSDNKEVTAHYRCPTYKTTDRRGVLSTTGHSTNFIIEIQLPRCEFEPESHWVMRGTALFTQLEY